MLNVTPVIIGKYDTFIKGVRFADEGGVWKTINGSPVFIKKGQSVEFSERNSHIDFTVIKHDLNNFQYEQASGLGKLITRMKDELVDNIIREGIIINKDFKAVDKLGLKHLGELRLLFKDMLRSGYKMGRIHSKGELKKKNFAVGDTWKNLPPNEALEYFDAKAFTLTGTEKERILNKIKYILYEGLKIGKSQQDIVYDLEKFFSDYDVMQLDSSGQEQPIEEIEGRLDTVVRTNTMDAYNQGRLNMFQESDMVIGLEYASVLDDRTTEVCEQLNGMKIKINNPLVAKYTPPNHFNCRGLWMPIFAGEDFEEDDFESVELPEGFGK